MMLGLSSKVLAQGTFFDRLIDNSLVLHKDGLAKSKQEVKGYVSTFENTNGKVSDYRQDFTIEVNANLAYEVGEIQAGAKSFSVMFLNRKDRGLGIEFLVIYEVTGSENQSGGLDKARNKWMKLCNAHQAGKLVEQLYTKDAYYYNRGRLLKGTKSITAEYGYMNSSSYSLKLTPKHNKFVTPEIAYEIGRCSGSYPLPYMLLWQKQTDGTWKVMMDSNY